MAIIDNQAKITGELSVENTLQGSLTGDTTLVGYLNVPTAVDAEVYKGLYVVDPSFDEQILETKHKMMKDNVTIEPIFVSKTTNLSGGNTVYIGGVYNG